MTLYLKYSVSTFFFGMTKTASNNCHIEYEYFSITFLRPVTINPNSEFSTRESLITLRLLILFAALYFEATATVT